MKIVDTYKADIYIGFKEGYSGKIHTSSELHEICSKYCDDVKLGITISHLDFVYVNGSEPGAQIGLINYPRFPSTKEEIKDKAITLARLLLKEFNQERCSIVCSDVTIMLEKD